MMQKILIVIVLLAVLIGGVFFFTRSKTTQDGPATSDPKNITYTIDGTTVTLVNGTAVTTAGTGSTSQITTTYFGNEIKGDLNGDGTSDTAFLITRNTGGDSTFYYLAVALLVNGKYEGTNAILLGDRIAPQSTEFRDGEVIVHYSDRASGEPMTTNPSVGVSRFFSVKDGKLVEDIKTTTTEVQYMCNAGKSVTASYVSDPGGSANPTGHVDLTFGDGTKITLAETLVSAEGTKYTNADGSLLFWKKGTSVRVLENNKELTYTGCIEVKESAGAATEAYHNGPLGFTIRIPKGYTPVDPYKYNALGPGKDIPGVKFSIPSALTDGTNLSKDSYVSVEVLPKVQVCSAKAYLRTGAVTQSVKEDGVTYSYATSSDAGAGNRYDESVYALSDRDPCIAVRYFIHYGAFENYPAGTVKEFDSKALTDQFELIRHTLVVAE